MDDALERPQTHLKPSGDNAEDEHSSGEEDEQLDWTKLP